MTLHWLTQIFQWLRQYPPSFLFCIIGGSLCLVGNGIRMLANSDKHTRAEVGTYLVGMVCGAGLAASYALRIMPQYKYPADILGHVGAISGIIYPFVWLNSRRNRLAPKPILAEPAATSDDIWPPPPTAPGGGQP